MKQFFVIKVLVILFTLLNISFNSSILLAEGKAFSFESTQQQNTLIELYTSEGCSSCPPADAWLSHLKNDPRLWKQVIPIAFHVDYWDYIGWKDPFALPANTSRQRLQLQQNNIASVYTPGFVVAGKEWRGFFNRNLLPFAENPRAGILKAAISDDQLMISYTGEQRVLDFNIVILGFDLQTSVKRGENAGRLLQHDFVALEHHVIPSNNNQVELSIGNLHELRKQNRGIAIWVSEQYSLVPLQAIGGRLTW